MRPQLLVAAGVSAAAVFVLSLGEIPVTALLRPAGFDVLTASLLNDMHYQRPRTVMLAGLGFLAAALCLATVIAIIWQVGVRRATRQRVFNTNTGIQVLLLAVIPAFAAVTLAGCSSDTEGGRALDVKRVFGTAGRGLGQFNYPRGLAVDASNERLFVVDKAARVQRFTLVGEPVLEWRMPAWENGKPVGLNVAPDGTVYVADTHYFRVIQYDAEGNEIMRFGEYGEGPGQFIFPTDVAFGPDGHIFVSEYGGNDRVQVFTAEGEFLYSFGGFGAAKGQFNRPQSIAFNDDKSRLYIADAVNHRIVIVNRKGEVQTMIGRAGREPGALSYPYDLVVQTDGSVLVCEYGNNRVQHLSLDGQCLGLYGRVGMSDGEMQYPWGLDATADELFILDSGNNRVQVIDRP
jgi:DNA-binding beta-propeller fold protein YncE